MLTPDEIRKLLKDQILWQLRSARVVLETASTLAPYKPYKPLEGADLDEALSGPLDRLSRELKEERELRQAYREIFDEIRKLFEWVFRQDVEFAVPDSGYPEGGGG